LQAADGPFVIAVGNDGQFRAMCVVLDLPTLADDERFATNSARVEHRDALREALAETLRTEPADTWVSRLGASGIPCGLVNQIDQAFSLAREVGLEPVVTVVGADGAVDTVANPLHLSRTPPTYRFAPPGVGEQSDEIRAELTQ
jgi:crotonobetainyl-CoA:carnitine CoA-transferase CaiB-like acyl-CoA transferase